MCIFARLLVLVGLGPDTVGGEAVDSVCDLPTPLFHALGPFGAATSDIVSIAELRWHAPPWFDALSTGEQTQAHR